MTGGHFSGKVLNHFRTHPRLSEVSGPCSTCRFWTGGYFKQQNKGMNNKCLHPLGHRFVIVPSRHCRWWEKNSFGKVNEKQARIHYSLTGDFTEWTFREPHSFGSR